MSARILAGVTMSAMAFAGVVTPAVAQPQHNSTVAITKATASLEKDGNHYTATLHNVPSNTKRIAVGATEYIPYDNQLLADWVWIKDFNDVTVTDPLVLKFDYTVRPNHARPDSIDFDLQDGDKKSLGSAGAEIPWGN